jgi:transcriptional regulator with XRE-family HTH domain
MSELLISPLERSRKAYSNVLQALQDPGTQRNLAQIMGTSESTISRIKTEKLEDTLALLYQLGFKLVSADRVCINRKRYEALETIARAAMAKEEHSRRLFLEEE